MELWEIQNLQFRNRGKAESETKKFLKSALSEHLRSSISNVELRPGPVSLNSFNGILELENGTRYFFKTHAQGEEILREYYNSGILTTAGYDVVEPAFISKKAGRQILVYPYLEMRTLFDMVRSCELGRRVDRRVLVAQEKLDRKTMDIYRKTWKRIRKKRNLNAPIHQLFYLRFGERFRNFYDRKRCVLPNFTGTFEELASMRWEINGVEYGTLNERIRKAKECLDPNCDTISVVGHGDAHNGNILFDGKRMMLFDPAFAGRHNPLLDVAKPLFHNVFAEWMYFKKLHRKLKITCGLDRSTIRVKHDFRPSLMRMRLFKSKMNNVVLPTIEKLSNESEDPTSSYGLLKSALFACSFLTTNLLDRKKYSVEMALLGFAISMQVGSGNSIDNLVFRR